MEIKNELFHTNMLSLARICLRKVLIGASSKIAKSCFVTSNHGENDFNLYVGSITLNQKDIMLKVLMGAPD